MFLHALQSAAPQLGRALASMDWDVDWVPIFEALSADLSAAKVPILGPKCRQSAEIPKKRRSIQIRSKRV